MTQIRLSSELIVEPVTTCADDEMVVAAARVSTIGVDSIDYISTPAEESAGLINFLMKNRHGTPFEHNMFTFFVKAPIKVYREWHRHRIGWSYNEESGRYKQLEPEFYIPPPERPMFQVPGSKPGQYDVHPLDMDDEGERWLYDMFVKKYREQYQEAYDLYEWALESDVPKEVARDCLPVTIYSSMWATANARTIMNFLSLRRKLSADYAKFPSKPMWEIDECAKLVEKEFARAMPITYQAYVDAGYVAP